MSLIDLEDSSMVNKRSEFGDYLKNKNVVIVGPSESFIGTDRGKYIDSFDVIVRLQSSYGRGYPVPDHYKIDIGTRTDVVYNNFDYSNQEQFVSDCQLAKESGVKWFASTRPHLEFDNATIKNTRDTINNNGLEY